MGLFTGLLTLPLAPVRGVVWLAEQIEREADRQWRDPASVRRQIAEVDAAFEAGQLTAAERDDLQDDLVARLLPQNSEVSW
ncbi:MAG TPA: gas vesicle protein GvpG [Jatrophihabitans sp.]|nr:gas vesicle protein GvpG [Jatrophihabitans sp.]